MVSATDAPPSTATLIWLLWSAPRRAVGPENPASVIEDAAAPAVATWLVVNAMAWVVAVPLLVTVILRFRLAAVISTVGPMLALLVALAATACAPAVRSMGVSAVEVAPLREISMPAARPTVVGVPVTAAAL